MTFEIQDYDGKRMYPGQVITYTLKPLFGIKINWMTIITVSEENKYFVDEQRFGPYALWHHQHHFKEIPGGVEMTDILHYAIPYSIIGRLANKVFVGKKLKEVFDYRVKAIEELFGKM